MPNAAHPSGAVSSATVAPLAADTRTLLDCASDWERSAPDRLWLTQPIGRGRVETWTWKEALDEARRMAAHLVSLQLPPHSNVALCSKNCAWWIIADLAIWMAGHVSVPLYPVLATDTVRYILDHSRARLLFVGKLDPVWQEMKHGVPAGLPRVAFPVAPPGEGQRWDELVARHAPLVEGPRRSRDELATIVYTSGSTGHPKGVMLSFGGMNPRVPNTIGMTADDRLFSYLPLAHAFERRAVEALSLRFGPQVFFGETPETFMDDLRRARPTFFFSVPRLWMKFQAGILEKFPPARLDRLLRIPIARAIVKRKLRRQLGLDCVRHAFSGSAPIPVEVIAWYRRLGLDLLEGYGMTENFSYSHRTTSGNARPGFVGGALPGVECRLGHDGEVMVKSPGTMIGYYRDPAQTAEAFTTDGFLKTGDLGIIDADGQLRITGRVKELFKTDKGKYIAPVPIENRIVHHPAIEQCCVAGVHHPQPHAMVVLSEVSRRRVEEAGRSSVEQELVALLESVNAELPPYERLAFLAVIDDPWLTENGFLTPTLKLRRSRVEQAYGPLAEAWYAAKMPVVWQVDARRAAAAPVDQSLTSFASVPLAGGCR